MFFEKIFYLAAMTLSLFFTAFGFYVLYLSYQLKEPSYFLLSFFAANFIILFSLSFLFVFFLRFIGKGKKKEPEP